jgi:hypothetical protein
MFLVKFFGLANLVELFFLAFRSQLLQVASINVGLVEKLGVILIGKQAMTLRVSLDAVLVLVELGLQGLNALGFVIEDGLVRFLLERRINE